MAVFESLASTLRALMIGEKIKVTLRPETGRLFPLEGRILLKSDAGNFSLQCDSGVIQIYILIQFNVTMMQQYERV